MEGLDDASWNYFKPKLIALLNRKHPSRWYEELCNTLNEAKAYNYLVRRGCTGVRFIPRSAQQGTMTPDLEGSIENIKILCEVKTINVSEKETTARNGGPGKGGDVKLPTEFLEKLKKTFKKAGQQMTSYCQSAKAELVAYVIVTFDDMLHACEPTYRTQIDTFVASNPVHGLEIVFDIKPRFITQRHSEQFFH